MATQSVFEAHSFLHIFPCSFLTLDKVNIFVTFWTRNCFDLGDPLWIDVIRKLVIHKLVVPIDRVVALNDRCRLDQTGGRRRVWMTCGCVQARWDAVADRKWKSFEAIRRIGHDDSGGVSPWFRQWRRGPNGFDIGRRAAGAKGGDEIATRPAGGREEARRWWRSEGEGNARERRGFYLHAHRPSIFREMRGVEG